MLFTVSAARHRTCALVYPASHSTRQERFITSSSTNSAPNWLDCIQRLVTFLLALLISLWLLVHVLFVSPIASRYCAFIIAFVHTMATEANVTNKWERRLFPVKSLVLLLWESLTFSGGKKTHGIVVWMTMNVVW